MKTLILALLVVAGAAQGALAQSKRYPPEPVDKDKERAAKSRLWESATNPQREPYQALIARAKQSIEARTPDELAAAIATLGEAIALLPHAADAYRWRGEAEFMTGAWSSCAQDLETAVAEGAQKTSDARDDRRASTDLSLRLGSCLARAGKLADAERVLADAAAGGTANGEMLMRLGEVRIALGKLDEAISALRAALEAPDPLQAQTRFLLASAYDRARRPAEAIEAAQNAAQYDRSLSTLTNPQLPFLGAGESQYLLGLAYALQEVPRPEYAMIFFRAFLKIAPDSPWRKRAEEHLRDLRLAALPDSVLRKGGNAALDLDAATALVRKAMPAMRACMAKVPFDVIDVTVTRSGPSSGPSPSPRNNGYLTPMRRVAPPPEAVTVVVANEGRAEATARADEDAAARCIEPLASRIPLPAVKELDAWWVATFSVVAP